MCGTARIRVAGLALGLLAALPGGAAFGLPSVQITNASDIAFSSWGMGDPNASAHIDLCIYAAQTLPAGGYGITASSAGGFVLKNTGNSALQLPYSVSWDDGGAGNLGATAGNSLNVGGDLSGQINASTALPLCSGPTARLNVRIAATDLTAALAGTYSGTLSLTISAN